MPSGSVSAGGFVVPIGHLQDLYDRHRYLDAYELTADCWNASFDVQGLSTDELILAGRLAEKLGGPRRSRWLFRAALTREAGNPRVRCFALHLSRQRPLDLLRAFEKQPDVGGEDREVRACWYAFYAMMWATLRDFRRAGECLDAAHEILPGDAYVLACESTVHGLADRWEDALESADRAVHADAGAPLATLSLGASLLNLGRVEEAAVRLFAAAEHSQSYEMAAGACWHQCALSETLEGQERRAVLEKAKWLAGRLPELAPLADRESRAMFARARLDIAALSDDYAEMERWSTEARSPFHRQVLVNLRNNRQGTRLRLPVVRTIQKHEGCLPASVSAVMSAAGLVISADDMAAEVTFGGTPLWAAADWLRVRGFHVRFFSVTPNLAAAMIQHRLAFVVSWDSDDSRHAVAAVGIDQRAGTLLAQDPQASRGAEYLLTSLDSTSGPLGVVGMAVVARDRGPLLDGLLPPESEVVEGAQDYQRALRRHGPSVARQIVAVLETRFPAHPGVRYLQAVQLLEDGCAGDALNQLQQLLREFPDSPMVRLSTMGACQALGNIALLRQVLRNVVERGVMPGVEAQQTWVRPPARYVVDYADVLRQSTATHDEAERLLHSVLRRQPVSAGAWHNLGDLQWQKGDKVGALLCHRLASCLAANNEHFARAYADALAAQQREEDGFGWLESRARTLGAADDAVGTWVSWISALEDRGHPARALAACNEALEHRPGSAELLTFAVPFFARMGLWDVAEKQLAQLKDAANPAAFYEVSARLLQMRGDLAHALENADAWIGELPHSMDARRTMLDLVATRDGPQAAVQQAAQWMQTHRNHDEFENAYCAQLNRTGEKKYSVLLRRVKRNPEDGWAWRELTFECLRDHERASDRGRHRLESRIEAFLAECDRTSSGSAATVCAHGTWLEQRGLWADAVATFLEAAAWEPERPFSIQHAWECSARFSSDERIRVWSEIRPLLLGSPGHLTIARQMMTLLVTRFGLAYAEREIEGWRVERPDDPEVLEAAADLLIEHGHGRSDADRALALLEPAVGRFPYHSGLRLSLAHAYLRAGNIAECERVLLEFVRRHPNDSSARIELARIRQRAADQIGAYGHLDAALEHDPLNPGVLHAHAEILLENRRFDEARDLVERGLQAMPRNVWWREQAIGLLVQCREFDKAIAVARQGVEVYPRGAMLWLVLGRTLNDMRRYAGRGEVESCLRRSLALNRGLFGAADSLSSALADQERHEEAAEVMRAIAERMADPSPANARHAWILRVGGQSAEALRGMIHTVTVAPWCAWGWHVLMDWLEQDQAWDQARYLLKDIPPQMFTDVSFRVHRLKLLGQAGEEPDRLDIEWTDLQRDFPETVSPDLTRSESLGEGGRSRAYAQAADPNVVLGWLSFVLFALVVLLQQMVRSC